MYKKLELKPYHSQTDHMRANPFLVTFHFGNVRMLSFCTQRNEKVIVMAYLWHIIIGYKTLHSATNPWSEIGFPI